MLSMRSLEGQVWLGADCDDSFQVILIQTIDTSTVIPEGFARWIYRVLTIECIKWSVPTVSLRVIVP